MIRRLLFAATMMLAAPVAAGPVVSPATDPAVRPIAAITGFRRLVPPAMTVAPAPLGIKLDVLRKGGLVVRDLPTGPPHVTVAKPVAGDLALSYYGIFGADAGIDFAQMRDRQGFIALNWQAGSGSIYLVDCELPGAGTATVVEVAIDGGGWLPATVSGGHLLYAVPALPPYPGYSTHAFAMRSTGTGFHGCEVSKVK
jgi:hypothetical protein